MAVIFHCHVAPGATIRRYVKTSANGTPYVAVIYSPGYGAGLSTWSDGFNPLDGDLAEFIDAGEFTFARDLIRVRYPATYLTDEMDLAIRWVPQGKRFFVREYDGAEHVVIEDEIDWKTA